MIDQIQAGSGGSGDNDVILDLKQIDFLQNVNRNKFILIITPEMDYYLNSVKVNNSPLSSDNYLEFHIENYFGIFIKSYFTDKSKIDIDLEYDGSLLKK